MKVTTPEYTDYVFLNDEAVSESVGDVRFNGRAGWIRGEADGVVRACVTDGDSIAAFGVLIEGRGPWSYNLDGQGRIAIQGTPRGVRVVTATL